MGKKKYRITPVIITFITNSNSLKILKLEMLAKVLEDADHYM